MNQHSGGPVFTIPISAAALSTAGAWDIAGITASSSGRLEIMEITLTSASTQFTTGPGLGITLLRGSTGTSTGTSITPQNVQGHTGASTANFTATGPSSTPSSTTSASVLHAGALDGHGCYVYRPKGREGRITLALSQRLYVRSTTPSIATTLYGTVTLQDCGKGLPS